MYKFPSCQNINIKQKKKRLVKYFQIAVRTTFEDNIYHHRTLNYMLKYIILL